MTFPTYHLYEELILARNTILLMIGLLVLTGFMLWGFTRRYKPAWSLPAMWIFGVGGFYATLAIVVVYYFVWASTH